MTTLQTGPVVTPPERFTPPPPAPRYPPPVTTRVPTPAPTVTPAPAPVTATPAFRYALAGVRIALGWIFLWAFVDKLFGFGYATPEQGAWINGGNPTKGFLANGAKGPFTDFYHNIAGTPWTNWLFMIGLVGIGLALITGIGVRVAAVSGSILLALMWSVALPPANNPFLDDHLIYIGALVVIALANAGDTLGFGRIWGRTALVRKAPYLK